MGQGRPQLLQSSAGEPGAEAHPRSHRGTGRPHLLRRNPRPRFDMTNGSAVTRLRRERRVSGTFSAIPDLARNGTD